MNGFGAPRARRRRTHPECPYRAFYPDRESAEHAAALLGSRAQACTRCGGFHMVLPEVVFRRAEADAR